MGTNTYHISFLSNKADVDLIMSHLKEVCRVHILINLANHHPDWLKRASGVGL